MTNYGRAGVAAKRLGQSSTAELASLGVHPSVARRGIGELLVRRFISEARDRGANTVSLTTDAVGNDAVNRFYAKTGFRLERQFEAYRGRLLNRYFIDAR